MIPPSLPAILIRRICTLSAAILATFMAFVAAVFVATTFADLMTGGGGPVAVFPAMFSPEMASCDQPVFRTRISFGSFP
jgi:hypothetical protein